MAGALGALLLLIAACAPSTGTGGILEGSRWVLDSYAQDGVLTIVPDQLYVDAEFRSTRVTGFSGCNEYSGIYRAGGRTLLVSSLATGMLACDQESMDLEQRFVALLDSSRFYSVRLNRLTVFDADRNAVLVFDAAPRNPLLGTWIVDSIATGESTVAAPIEGTELDVTFKLATVAGSSGCNGFSGTYGTNGNVVRVGRLAITGVACDAAVMEQEQAFLAALQGVAFIEVRGPRVNLTDRNGRLLVGLVDPASLPEPSPSPSPSASASPSASPTASPTPSPTASPTQAPTAAPTASPTASPTATASASPTAAPPSVPPVVIPPSATCELAGADDVVVATITYPGGWSTLAEPPEAACRYFDPEPITVPTDGTAIVAAVRADLVATPYADVVAAATDPATWTVTTTSTFEIEGTPVTCVSAVRTAAPAAGEPNATTSCMADAAAAGTVVIWTTGTQGDPAFLARSAVVSLMTVTSTFAPPG